MIFYKKTRVLFIISGWLPNHNPDIIGMIRFPEICYPDPKSEKTITFRNRCGASSQSREGNLFSGT